MEEIWKDVVGYEGLYLISNLGRVKSVTRKTPDGRTISGKIMSPYLNNGGYFMITLSMFNKKKRLLIHRLVASTFIPNPDNKPQVNHIDENKQNNCVNNLNWMTNKENQEHGTRTDRQAKSRSLLITDGNAIYIGIKSASEKCGIPRSTLQRWVHKDMNGWSTVNI